MTRDALGATRLRPEGPRRAGGFRQLCTKGGRTKNPTRRQRG
eukprot:UN1017